MRYKFNYLVNELLNIIWTLMNEGFTPITDQVLLIDELWGVIKMDELMTIYSG